MSERLAQRLHDGLDEHDLDRLWRQRLERKSAARSRVRWWLVGLSAALAGVLTFALTREAAHVVPGPLEVVLHDPERMTFSDASTVAIAPETHFAVRANDGARVDTVLDEGEVRLSVTPGGPRRWTIDCGVATVVVVGTELSITRRGAVVTVTVHHGRVLVRSPSLAGGEQSVGAGETITVGEVARTQPEVPQHVDVATHPEPEARDDAQVDADVVVVVEPAPEPAPAPKPKPRDPTSAPPVAPTPSLPPVPEDTPKLDATFLLSDADDARTRGDHARAAQILDQFLALEPLHPRAPLAAFTLGRIEADTLHRPARAAAAFERALTGLPASLVPDALARLALARSAAGDPARARAAAERYLEAYPDGTRAAAMRALLE